MPEQAGDFTGIRSALRTLVDQEGASLGLSATALTQYKNRLVSHYKAGNYTLCGSGACLEYISVAGVAEVPRCSLGVTSTQNYVWGIFISGASNKTAAGNTFQAAKVEPLREPIRAALSNWSCSNAPGVTFQSDMDGRLALQPPSKHAGAMESGAARGTPPSQWNDCTPL